MKELSIEQKAEAYDKFTEVLKEMFADKEVCGLDKSLLQKLFSELQENKESEDERIRKALIEYFQVDGYCVDIPTKDVRAWLEKQGEQKPTDKIEPKFKVGDWVVRGKTIARILDIQEQYYVGFDTDGNDFTSSRFLSDDKIHLWTIQDAKDGDVLSYSDSRHTWLCIFKELKNQRCYDYCSYRNKDEIGFWPRSNWNYDKTLSYKPATKEQRNLLFQKMKEAGYEWDSEKKELKKIEQKSIEWNEKIKGLDELETYVLSLVPDRPLDAVKVDSKNIRFLINKEQKSSWSEEDEKMFNKLLAVIALYYGYSGNVLDKQSCTSFLKSLKDRYTWEPSEEQMDALRYVINFDYGGHKATLVSLYEQLKKLK